MLLIIFNLLFFLTDSLGQAPGIAWQKYYGGSDGESMDIILEIPGGYIIGGGTTSNDGDVSGNHGGADLWIVCIDTVGNVKWQKCFGGSLPGSLGKIITMNSNSFIYAGGEASNDGDVLGNHNPGTLDGWIFEFDSLGNILRQKCFGGSNHDGFNGIIANQDGSFIAWGGTQSDDGDLVNTTIHGSLDLWIVKIDSSWNILWQKRYGGSQAETAAKLIQTSDNSFIVSGYTKSNDGDISSFYGDTDYWLIKVDSAGNLLWEKTYGGSGYDFCFWTLLSYMNSGFIIGGYTESTDNDVAGNHGYVDNWILFVDSIGGINWSHCYGGIAEDNLHNIALDQDSGIIICGSTNSDDGDVSGNHYGNCLPYPCADFWILKIDSQGNLLWQKCYGGGDVEIARGIEFTSDSGYLAVVSGTSIDGDAIGSNYHGNSDAWVVKLAQLPNEVFSLVVPFTNLTCFISSSILHLNYSAISDHTIQLQLFDITGRLLFEKSVVTVAGKNELTFPIKEVKVGVYFLRIGNEVCKVFAN